jgi:UPF0755 protein
MPKLLKSFFVLFLFCALGLLGGSGYYIYTQWQKPSALQQDVLFQVPKGATTHQISLALQKNGMLQSPRAFRLWCKYKGVEGKLSAGYFKIPAQATIPQIAEILTQGKTATLKATIPEGRASWEIVGILKKKLPLDSALWDSLVHSAAFAASLGVEAGSLEGYLLPGTYLFDYESDTKSVLQFLVRENLKLRDELKAKPGSTWAELGSWHRVLTMASVVEEETGIPAERPHIAGVFLHRLRIGMPLGADPTVRFIFRNLTGPIYKSQLNSDSPYNTRKFKGLMPGPISNPGRKAIEATLFPQDTKDLYFVAKDDGSMTHFFCPTLDCHNEHKDKAAKNRGE